MSKWMMAALALVGAFAACSSDSDDSNAGKGGSGGSGADSGVGGGSGGSGGTGGTDAAPCPPDAGTPSGSLAGLTLELERATPEQIAFRLLVTSAVPADAKLNVRYKRTCDPDWRDAHPAYRVNPAWIAGGAPVEPVDSFAGTIFDLIPGTSYEIELTLVRPGQADERMVAVAATRGLPAAAGAVTVTATPADDLQAKLDALGPGDVLELADGSYAVDGLFLASSGTEAQPIYIRGQSRSGVILQNPGRVLQIQEASHVVIENMTLEGSGVDSGTDASSVGISFWDGALQENITLRQLDITGVDMGIVASGTIQSVLVYESSLRGNNVWTPEFIETNLTWNDDGIRVPGQGNCVFQNTLHGFGDSLAVTDGVESVAVYFYRNRITMTGDDSFEADYGTRNLGFYDNYVTNASTLLSLDPLWGGPLYCFRNVIFNTVRGPFKLNNTNSGFFVYNNTIVRTEGTTDWGWVQFNNGALQGWSFRNNVLVYRGTSGNLLAIESDGNDPIDFTHNAWYPDGSVWWSATGGSFSSIAEARAGVPATTALFGASTSRHQHDVITESEPFASPIPLGSDHLTELDTSLVPAPKAGAAFEAAGTPIPNVTDGFSGTAPDMGAIITGRPPPAWGAPAP
jgi:hypothetical protein